ncbi:O-antigen ligase family protein [Hyphomicrobium sp.]|jgi:O-antigen ligase|uniref:O-antigen ligase family protein n=1 Tax=Hyphomicrobium sp. TaxID=82 RepID=UPI003563ADC2
MLNVNSSAGKSQFSSREVFGGGILACMPVFVYFYILLVLPFMAGGGKARPENILFWPVMAAVIFALVLQNWSRINTAFLRSLPIASLIAYLVFASASVTWAYSPNYAFSRAVVTILAAFIIVMPYALPINTKHTIARLHICCAAALAISAVYVLTTPSTPIGHPGYFTHKQELGLLAATGLILASHELLFGSWWRRIIASVSISLSFWLVFASQSKSALAFALAALVTSAVVLVICKKIRITPAHIVGAVVIASLFVHNPIERIGYRIYGDSTLTGRTGIWEFTNYQISRRPWLGWGFHSYYFVPNSPQNEAKGYIKDMPSSHSGYLQLKLETGRLGYWIFLVFIYASLYFVELVRRRDPVRAWFILSIEIFAILINLTDTVWLTLTDLWILYLIVVADSVNYSLSPQLMRGVRQISRSRIVGKVVRTARRPRLSNA